MQYNRQMFSDQELMDVYPSLLLPRMIEEKMLIYLRQGKITKWFSGIGQEAIAVGAALGMHADEWIMPLHRNLGVFTTRNIPLHKLFSQWQGHLGGFTKGRDRSFHFGAKEYHIAGMISHLGPQLSVANGAALACQLKKESRAALAFTGEGGTSEGEFHEALNVASVWNLPVIFVIENNGYGLSTPVSEQYRCEHLVDRARGYGMEGVRIDGNNILEVIDTIRGVREYCIREQRPYLIECATFRMRGHEEASGTKYVPQELIEKWMLRDPVRNFEYFLAEQNILSFQEMKDIKEETKNLIEAELEKSSREMTPPILSSDQIESRETGDVYASKPAIQHKAISADREEDDLRLIDAITEGLDQSMQQHDNLVLMGQDIAGYGGVFKITDGFVEKFGKERVRNTPLCESAIVGAGLGLSLENYKSVVEMQFADFVAVGFNQIVNNLAKIHYRWGQPADVVIRMPTGAGVAAGPFHSQSTEAWFTHVPGLKVVYPSNPAEAKGLLIAAINDPNPVMYFEHKHLYRSVTGPVPTVYYETEIGKASRVRIGSDISIITYGLGVIWATDFADRHSGISIDILDLRTLAPLDYRAIKESVRNTGKVLVLHEDTMTGGLGGEVAAWIGQHCFEYLDAPVMRCASLDTPIPFNKVLEDHFLAKQRLAEAVSKLVEY